MSSKALKKMQFFKPFDISTSTGCDQEHVLYVQAALFPFAAANSSKPVHKDDENDENINETWYSMFTTQRFIICKKNDEGMIIDRKQLSFKNIMQFKLKKNKRFKKSNLPAIKIYIDDGSGSNNDNNMNSLKTPLKSLKKDKDDDKYPSYSINDIQSRDTFHTKMVEIIGSNKTSKSRVNGMIHHLILDLIMKRMRKKNDLKNQNNQNNNIQYEHIIHWMLVLKDKIFTMNI